MNRIKRVAIVAGLTLATATAASAAYNVLLFDGHSDYQVATTLDTPCGPYGLKGPAQPVTFDKTLWLVFTCQDDTVVARRLHVTAMAPVTMVSLPVFIAGGRSTVGDWKFECVEQPRPHCAQ